MANLQSKNNKKQKEIYNLGYLNFVICHIIVDIDKSNCQSVTTTVMIIMSKKTF